MAETLEILELLFTGEPVSYHGTYYRLEGALARPRPLQDRIPIHLGGAGPKVTMPLAARFADWWNCPSYGVDRLDELRSRAGTCRVSVQHVIGLAPSHAGRAETVAVAERRFGGWGGLICGTADEVAAAWPTSATRASKCSWCSSATSANRTPWSSSARRSCLRCDR